MSEAGFQYIYGPVSSRRLGRSLGIDLVPFKTCTYDCVYCQLGHTTNKTVERKEYVAADDVLHELKRKLAMAPAPDYISLAGSGEPTLNACIGDLIQAIKSQTQIPVAVLTNGSLLWMPEVREALMEADLILPSLDAGDARLYQSVNRPHEKIQFEKMVSGLVEFAQHFPGSVWLEVFLLAGVTGTPLEVEKIAGLVRRIRPDRVQLNTVSRPPAEEFAIPVSRAEMERLRRFFDGVAEAIGEGEQDESLTPFSAEISDADILALLSRRPCTLHGVSAGLGLNASEAAKRLQGLSQRGSVRSVRKNDAIFYEAVRTR